MINNNIKDIIERAKAHLNGYTDHVETTEQQKKDIEFRKLCEHRGTCTVYKDDEE